MTEPSPLSGRLENVSFPRVLYQIVRESIDGALSLECPGGGIAIHLEDQRIRSVLPGPEAVSLDQWLVQSKELSPGEALERVRRRAKTGGISFGRAMMEEGLWDPESFWKWESLYQIHHLYRCFDYHAGTYSLITGTGTAPPGVRLDLPLRTAIVRGIRGMSEMSVISRELSGVHALYVRRRRTGIEAEFKPHENHVLELIVRQREVEKVIADSLYPREQTLRIMFMLLAADQVSTRPVEEGTPRHREENRAAHKGTFNSFDDALKYYNQKYEMIFRVLSKEIGPIALSILQKAVTGISENLPACLRKASLRSGGGLEEEPVLRSVWYQDFERTIGEFLRGLEEILYAQIFAVKKHLGVDVEQQILKWLNRIEK